MTGGIDPNDKRFRPNVGYLSRPWKKAWGRAGALIGLALGLVAAVPTYALGIADSPEAAAVSWFILIAGLTLAYSLVFIPISMFAIWTISSDHLGK
jgi:hypothetical protein